MSSEKDLKEFPDVAAKLQKPSKQSAFDKQKADAEAKRQREAAETEAVYKDFIKSFNRDEGDDHNVSGGRDRDARSFGALPGRGGGGAPKRHFGASGLKSGPGSLGPPPGGFGKKLSFQDFARGTRKAFAGSDEDDEDERAEEKAIARPTLRLTNLPPGTSPSVIKALVQGHLTVEDVKIQSSSGHGSLERKSAAAIVTLSQDTPGVQIEATVSALQNRYLGYGHYLSLHRHLSSAVAGVAGSGATATSNADSRPFGAKHVEQPASAHDTRPQAGFQRGFAPPTSYNQPMGGVSRAGLLHVPVKPPNDVRTLQLINLVIERVLEHGPEYEALLMSRPEVQREERWAWLWDARSAGGVWYRWRLWEVITDAKNGRSQGRFVPLFEGGHAWKTPERRLPFEYTTRLDEFVSDSDYSSDDEEDTDGEGKEAEQTFLNPLEKAKLTHLLARLPTSLTRLRKGDIARVAAFALMHASRGCDEVVDMIVSNIEKPFALTAANPHRPADNREKADETGPGEVTDNSAANLIGLYVVSDILSASSTSGVRHAWRFRQLFEAALRDRNVFERLGCMAEKYGWGRMRADKWQRSVNLVLNLWEGACMFPVESQEMFVKTFAKPPSLQVVEEKMEDDEMEKKGKWKTVQISSENARVTDDHGARRSMPADDDIAGEPIEDDDVAGEPMDEDDIAGEPIDEDDVEGEPILDEDVEGEPTGEDEVVGGHQPPQEQPTGEKGVRKKPRMRAVDMFADSDGSGGEKP
ncbi:U2 snRNP-associated SURP motif-containing protein-like protein [Emericellopsis cladophorae]|uniref:U2 snRNP-associated SURP motif-containing protein-like protein n=1 Tax=Emericellopsis cladophorae TaxID=2686198 RepID=A0A9Q0BH85_9HYPO|nr:U2 snRNP-associated SURP motif-containing protein-like protein [Emericellopsis cladophorae]KAI6784475.1 U2 snRNP-associated SURP motif-containing protein-like protein [Emericellopsis cladophorae]